MLSWTSSQGPPASGRTRQAWLGARMVKRTPASASTSSVSSSAAVSGSHIPSASRPKRWRKSSRPQRTWVILSARLARTLAEWGVLS